MSKIVRFRTLKHGDPPRFKVLPEDLGKKSRWNGHATSTGSFPIMVLALVAFTTVVLLSMVVG